MKNYNLTAY